MAMAATYARPRRPAVRGFVPALPALGFILVFTVGPLTLMAVYSVLKAAAYGGVEWQWSADAYMALLFRKDIFSGGLAFSADHLMIYGRSLAFAAATTALCIVVGFPTAWFIASRPQARRKWWILAITVPFWTSLLVRSLALMLIIGDSGLINGTLMAAGLASAPIRMLYTDFAVMLGLVYTFLPFMVLPIFSSLEKLDPRLVEASRDLYANGRQIVVHVLVPAARPGIVAGTMLVFVPALGSYVVPLILGGGRSMMIGDLIALQFGSSRNWPLGAAESVVLLVGVFAALLAHRAFEGKRT